MRTSDGKRGYSALEPSEDYPEFESKVAGHLRIAKMDGQPESTESIDQGVDNEK